MSGKGFVCSSVGRQRLERSRVSSGENQQQTGRASAAQAARSMGCEQDWQGDRGAPHMPRNSGGKGGQRSPGRVAMPLFLATQGHPPVSQGLGVIYTGNVHTKEAVLVSRVPTWEQLSKNS